MNKKQSNSVRASALQITLRVILISFFAALLTFAAAPAQIQIERKRRHQHAKWKSYDTAGRVNESLYQIRFNGSMVTKS